MRLFIALCTLWLTWLSVANASDEKVLICYHGSWATYRSGSGKFDISDIDASLCTHLIYSFVGITGEGNVSVLDPWRDLADDGGKDGFGEFVALKENNTNLKTLVAIGGWTQGSENFSIVVDDEDLRATFVQNALKFVQRYGFDGLDVDWEYPAQRGGSEANVQNFVYLLEELHEVFESEGLILSVAVGASTTTAGLSYNVSGIAPNVDLIHLMTYDYHGSWDSVTGHNTPMYAAARETTELDQTLNIDVSVRYWLANGAPAEKLVLGTATYGKSFTLTNSSLHVPGSPILAGGTAGEFTGEAGVLAYYEICTANWTVAFDEEQRVPYAYSGDQWVSYDNVESITEKVNYIKDLGLAGGMVWAIENDDFRGLCGPKNPILTVLHNELLESASTCN